jgi:hypothetical protein
MKGWPKQVEKVGLGSVTPSSVPGVFLQNVTKLAKQHTVGPLAYRTHEV